MINAATRRAHQRWLRELTSIPTAAGREHRVIEWVEHWVRKRANLRLRRDGAGNLIISRKARRSGRPIYVTAHLDHPAFVVRQMLDERRVELDFRGGVNPPYFDKARIEIFDESDRPHAATIESLDARAKPFKRVVAKLSRSAPSIAPGDVGRWRLAGKLSRVTKGLLHAHACDDLAGVAAALAALDVMRKKRSGPNLGVLLTRAEEIGFVGTLAACEARTVSKQSRLICLENSRSFADSPIGGGPILRVGDRKSVFAPTLTNRIAAIMSEHEKRHPTFRWQRKLMPGGQCEATAFSIWGYESTCLCLPLGNYHNMIDIDGVLAGKHPARVGPEHIAVADYHGLIEMIVVSVMRLDESSSAGPRARFKRLLAERAFVLEE